MLSKLKKGQIISLGDAASFTLGAVVTPYGLPAPNPDNASGNAPTGLSVTGTNFVMVLNDCEVPGQTVYFVPVYSSDSAILGMGTVQSD